MSQKAHVRLEFNSITDIHLRNELRAWFHRQHSRSFTDEETLLQCIVALRYLNGERPTVAMLMAVQHLLIMKDARVSGAAPMRACSYSTLRNRIADLPRRLVKKARRCGKSAGPSIADTIEHFDAASRAATSPRPTPEGKETDMARFDRFTHRNFTDAELDMGLDRVDLQTPVVPSPDFIASMPTRLLVEKPFVREARELFAVHLEMWASDFSWTMAKAYAAMCKAFEVRNREGAGLRIPSHGSFVRAARRLGSEHSLPRHLRRHSPRSHD